MTRDHVHALLGVAALAVLVLLGYLLVRIDGPGKAPHPSPLELRIASCDRLPDLNQRVPCWRDAYRKEKRR